MVQVLRFPFALIAVFWAVTADGSAETVTEETLADRDSLIAWIRAWKEPPAPKAAYGYNQ